MTKHTIYFRTLIFGLMFYASTSIAVVDNRASVLLFTPGGEKPVTRVSYAELFKSPTLRTKADEILEVILPTGAVITVGKNSEIRLEAYQDALATGDPVNITLTSGSLRVVSGFAQRDIKINYKGNSFLLQSGEAMLQEEPDSRITAMLVYGQSLAITNGQEVTRIVKPGFSVSLDVVAGQASSPKVADSGTNGTLLGSLHTGSFDQEEDEMEDGCDGCLEQDSGESGGNLTSLLADANEATGVVNTNNNSILISLNGQGFGPGETLSSSETTSGNSLSQSSSDLITISQIMELKKPIGELSNDVETGMAINLEDLVRVRSPGRTTNSLYTFQENGSHNIENGKPKNLSSASDSEEAIYSENIVYSIVKEESGPYFYVILSAREVAYDDHLIEKIFWPSSSVGLAMDGAAIIPLSFSEFPLTGNVFTKSNEHYSNSYEEFGGPYLQNSNVSFLMSGFSFPYENPSPDEPIFNENNLMYRSPDNFLMFQAQDESSPENKYYFAAGDVDSRLEENWGPEFSIDQFTITSGLVPCLSGSQCDHSPSETVQTNIRSFGRTDTALGMELIDSGLLVVNSESANYGDNSRVFHVDFGLEGESSNQISTISTTVGSLTYTTIDGSVEAILDADTVGSSMEQGNIVGFYSPLTSTAAGGGNPLFFNGTEQTHLGYAEYLALENYDPDQEQIYGGYETVVGDSYNQDSIVNYAYFRLATATETTTVELGRSDGSLSGWVGGLSFVETSNGDISLVQIDYKRNSNNLTSLQWNRESNTVEAIIELNDRDTIPLGGLVDATASSAYIDDDHFAASYSTSQGSTEKGTNLSLVSGNAVRDGLPEFASELFTDIDGKEYEHIKWGFFFGDINYNGSTREHLHLNTWVAGIRSETGLSGDVIVEGHAIGNVYNNGSTYLAVGTYTNTWNFQNRSGEVDFHFDGLDYEGQAKLNKSNNIDFTGLITSDDRVGEMVGNFVDSSTSASVPVGEVGRFSISERPDSNDVYRASGTFSGKTK
ncbi:hypothetical protein [Ketobacter sp.]|uniref:hypothetical protein n=1 Tax=Ketobacter sp. TaxID=2083498 RepID=UPI000F23AD9F|nr:hypothetical protein [Ketobacter sp.]RLU01761.1 MAG: hypothetical protein D9N14_01085 [Ketobacter sp.]